MSTRIRYIETKVKGVFVGTRKIRSQKTNALYSIELDLNEMDFKIRNMGNGHIVKRGTKNVKNIHVLKRNVKKALKQLGVKFDLEIRNRNYGICEKKND
jgi:hypothetical protein